MIAEDSTRPKGKVPQNLQGPLFKTKQRKSTIKGTKNQDLFLQFLVHGVLSLLLMSQEACSMSKDLLSVYPATKPHREHQGPLVNGCTVAAPHQSPGQHA